MKLVEFCNANMQKGTQGVYETLENRMDIDCVDYECTNNCGLCSKMAFALVEGQIVSAKDSTKLLEKIEKKLDKLDDEFNEQYLDF